MRLIINDISVTPQRCGATTLRHHKAAMSQLCGITTLRRHDTAVPRRCCATTLRRHDVAASRRSPGVVEVVPLAAVGMLGVRRVVTAPRRTHVIAHRVQVVRTVRPCHSNGRISFNVHLRQYITIF